MITKSDVEKALASSHASCKPECIHADGITPLEKELRDRAAKSALVGMLAGGSKSEALFSVLFEGIHIGYRLAQVQQERELGNLVNSANTKSVN